MARTLLKTPKVLIIPKKGILGTFHLLALKSSLGEKVQRWSFLLISIRQNITELQLLTNLKQNDEKIVKNTK